MSAFENPGMKLAREASADLSTAQYKAVKLNSSSQAAPIAANTDVPLGILQDKPAAAGRAAEIMVSGISQMYAGAAVTAGQVIGIDASGRGVPLTVGTDTTRYAIGQALTSASGADVLFAVLFNCVQPNRAA